MGKREKQPHVPRPAARKGIRAAAARLAWVPGALARMLLALCGVYGAVFGLAQGSFATAICSGQPTTDISYSLCSLSKAMIVRTIRSAASLMSSSDSPRQCVFGGTSNALDFLPHPAPS